MIKKLASPTCSIQNTIDAVYALARSVDYVDTATQQCTLQTFNVEQQLRS